MQPIITFENLRNFAYVNTHLLKRKPRGMVLFFFGLGNTQMYDTDPNEGSYYAERDILYVVPYNNPWSWMNRRAVEYTDEIIDVLMNAYALPEDTPIVSTGGSMGGLAALVYSVYAKRTPACCVANCPVCDLPYHYTERADLPRTLYSAFYGMDGTLEQALQTASPLHLVERMPKIPYVLFHCEEDKAVNKQKHSDRLVQAMEQNGHSVTYHSVAGKGHCDLTQEMWDVYFRAICQSIERRQKA